MLGLRRSKRPHLVWLFACALAGFMAHLYNLDLWDLTVAKQSDDTVVTWQRQRRHRHERKNETDAVVPKRGSHKDGHVIPDDRETVVAEAKQRDERRQRKRQRHNNETDDILPAQIHDEDDNSSHDDGGDTQQQQEQQQKRERQNEKDAISNSNEEYKMDRISPDDHEAAPSKDFVDAQQHEQPQLRIQNIQKNETDARIPKEDKYQDDHMIRWNILTPMATPYMSWISSINT